MRHSTSPPAPITTEVCIASFYEHSKDEEEYFKVGIEASWRPFHFRNFASQQLVNAHPPRLGEGGSKRGNQTFGIKPEPEFQYCSVDGGIEEVSERSSFSECWTLHCGIL